MDEYKKLETELNSMINVFDDSLLDQRKYRKIETNGSQVRDINGDLVSERFESLLFPGKTYFLDYKTK